MTKLRKWRKFKWTRLEKEKKKTFGRTERRWIKTILKNNCECESLFQTYRKKLFVYQIIEKAS